MHCELKIKFMIRYIKYSLSQVLKNRDSNGIKIILLAFSFAICSVLIAKLYKDYTYDNYVEDIGEVYKIEASFKMNNKLSGYTSLSGGVAPMIAKYSPEVEVATRYTFLGSDMKMNLIEEVAEDEKIISAERVLLADSLFFDIFNREVKGGDAKKLLGDPGKLLVSESFAKRMLGDKDVNSAIGKVIAPKDAPELEIAVDAIYEDFPSNSMLAGVDAIVSLPSIGMFSYDGSNELLGNDRYTGYIRLKQNTKAEDIVDDIDRFIEENYSSDLLIRNNIEAGYVLKPLDGYYRSQKDVAPILYVLFAMVIGVIVIAVFNYVLITISSLVRRAKMVAVNKCYGASKLSVANMLITESIVVSLISLMLAFIIMMCFESLVTRVTETTYSSLFSADVIVILIIVFLTMILLSGTITGFIFAQVPVSASFKRYKESNKRWKQTLLTVQITGAMFFIATTMIIWRQYNYMLNVPLGYSFDNVAVMSVDGLANLDQDKASIKLLKQEIANIEGVEQVSLSATIPIYTGSGNMVFLPEDYERQFFNVVDNYTVDENYRALYDINIIEGRDFDIQNPVGNEVLVSRSFVKEMNKHVDWSDGVIGKEFGMSEHMYNNKPVLLRICGVFDDFIINNTISREDRSMVIHSSANKDNTKYFNYLSIKTDNLDADILNRINERSRELFPELKPEAFSYEEVYNTSYDQVKHIRDIIVYSGLIVVIIALIGLIGYIRDEVMRRKSEIAIRKINGASIQQIITLFARDIAVIVVFGLVLGSIGSYMAGEQLLMKVAYKIDLSLWIFLLASIILMMIISAVVFVNVYHSANSNPIKHLGKE